MVASNLTRPPPPRISVPAGDEASGLAEMVAGLLAANLADSRARAAIARLARGQLVLSTTDRPAAVTLTFHGDEVIIDDGAVTNAPSLAGPWLELAHVCSGTRSPAAALIARDLRVACRRRPHLAAMAGFVLAAPADVDTAAARRRRAVRTLAAPGAVAIGAVARSSFCAVERRQRPRPRRWQRARSDRAGRQSAGADAIPGVPGSANSRDRRPRPGGQAVEVGHVIPDLHLCCSPPTTIIGQIGCPSSVRRSRNAPPAPSFGPDPLHARPTAGPNDENPGRQTVPPQARAYVASFVRSGARCIVRGAHQTPASAISDGGAGDERGDDTGGESIEGLAAAGCCWSEFPAGASYGVSGDRDAGRGEWPASRLVARRLWCQWGFCGWIKVVYSSSILVAENRGPMVIRLCFTICTHRVGSRDHRGR